MHSSTECFGVTIGKAGLLAPAFLGDCFLVNLQIQELVPPSVINPWNRKAHYNTLLQAGQAMWNDLLSFFNFSPAWAEQIGVQMTCQSGRLLIQNIINLDIVFHSLTHTFFHYYCLFLFMDWLKHLICVTHFPSLCFTKGLILPCRQSGTWGQNNNQYY